MPLRIFHFMLGALWFNFSRQKLNYKIVGRREGDITEAYANTDKANTILGWKTTLNLDDSLKSAWKWEQKIRS